MTVRLTVVRAVGKSWKRMTSVCPPTSSSGPKSNVCTITWILAIDARPTSRRMGLRPAKTRSSRLGYLSITSGRPLPSLSCSNPSMMLPASSTNGKTCEVSMLAFLIAKLMGKFKLHGAFTIPSVVSQSSSPTLAPSGSAQPGVTRHSSGRVRKNAWKFGWSAGSLIS